MPSPKKMPGDLDDSSVVDPISELHKHFVPNQSDTAAANVEKGTSGEGYDPCAIEAMEEEYEGRHSTREERCS